MGLHPWNTAEEQDVGLARRRVYYEGSGAVLIWPDEASTVAVPPTTHVVDCHKGRNRFEL